MPETFKISFSNFAAMDKDKNGKLSFEEFFNGLTPESIALLKSNNFEKEKLPDAPKGEAQNPNFFKDMYRRLLNAVDGNKNRLLEERELKQVALNISTSGMVVRVTKVSADPEDNGWVFTTVPEDNGWEPAPKKAKN